jgi:hypothetical protein
MAAYKWPELSPWRRRQLAIPPDSLRDWVALAVWEFWMGSLVSAAVGFGIYLIATAPGSIVTVFDSSNCYATPVVQPCERVAYRVGGFNAVFNIWCGVLLLALAVWLLWELWSAVAPKPVTDDFLKLLDDSFGRDWRKPWTWPWTRIMWAYGFTLAGVISAIGIGVLISTVVSRSTPAMSPTVETSQSYRLVP